MKEEERKNSEPPVKLIAKIEDLGVLSSVEDAKKNGETGGGGNGRGSDSKAAAKKAIIVEKSTGAPLVTVRSRRSIMESRFRLTLKTWDDVWRSTSWAKNPPKQIKMAAASKDGGDKNAAGEPRNGRLASDAVERRAQTGDDDDDDDDDDDVPPQSSNEEKLRKSVSDTNVKDGESSEKQPMLHIATDEDIAVREKEASSVLGRGDESAPIEAEAAATTHAAAPAPAPAASTAIANALPSQATEKQVDQEATSEAAAAAAEDDDVVDGVENAATPSSGPLPKKIKNTRFMVVPSVQIPTVTSSEAEDGVDKEEAASSDSEDASSNRNAASRNRVPMFESRLNELTMVESQLKKLDFKPMHLELPEDRDSDDSANSKTITAAEGKTMKMRDAIPPRRNNSLEGAYPSMSKKKSSKGGAGAADVSKPSWGWLSIFRRKPSDKQIATPSTTTSATSSSSSSKISPTPAAAATSTGAHPRSAANSAARATSGHQSRSRQPQRQTTTVASARRAAAAAAAAAQQPNSQANARVVLIQIDARGEDFVDWRVAVWRLLFTVGFCIVASGYGYGSRIENEMKRNVTNAWERERKRSDAGQDRICRRIFEIRERFGVSLVERRSVECILTKCMKVEE
ncbi:hypothetical protein V9T40_007918 [Parthenolecanium corni]|uniref:Uncharacterized protein n=1 Tax=Parthenolecanium corni TaxID=536013 RepID=A0AAN9Y8I3_9HEMI